MSRAQLTKPKVIAWPRVLLKTGWFAECPAEFQARMMELARWQIFRPGEQLYELGDYSDAIYGVETGAFDISIAVSSGEMASIWRAQPGSWHGSSVFSQDKKRPATGIARLESLVLVLPTAALERSVANYPGDLRYFYDFAYRNLIDTLQVLGESIVLPARVRFARLLLRLAPVDDWLAITQKELGAMVGMSRATFRRNVADLIDLGIVRMEYGAVRILDRAALIAVADQD